MVALAVVVLGFAGVSLIAEQTNTSAPSSTNALPKSSSTNTLPKSYSGYVFDQFEWVNASTLPAGATMALLESTPSKAGPYTVRYKLPAGYRIPLSWSSTDERVTVLSGLLNIGMSPSYDKSSSKAIAAGSFAFIPGKMRFTAWTDVDTVIQVHGIGPSELVAVFP